MKTKTLKNLLLIIVLVIVLGSISGTYATWYFSDNTPPSPIEENMNLRLTIFSWEGSDILPEDEIGYNHVKLVSNLIYGTMISNGQEVGIGLNHPDSELNAQLDTREKWGRTTFGSMDVWEGEQVENIFGLEAAKLSFMIYSPKNDPSVKYIYTTGVELGSAGLLSDSGFTYPVGERIYPIYRTKLNGTIVGRENNQNVYEWTAEKTVLGSALSARYENTVAGSSVVRTPAFDPTSFNPVSQEDCETGDTIYTPGVSPSTAFLTYIGQHLQGELASANSSIYMKIKATSTTVSFTHNTEGLTFWIYSDANFTNGINKNSQNLLTTFSATRNTTYYYKVTSTSLKVDFTIS